MLLYMTSNGSHTQAIGLDERLECVGVVHDPLLAKDAIRMLKPHVLTIDMNMPNMDGVQLLNSLRGEEKVPAIVVSSLDISDGNLVLSALSSGAVDYIQKPDGQSIANFALELNTKIFAVGHLTLRDHFESPQNRKRTRPSPLHQDSSVLDSIILIGASTGGTEAIAEVLADLPKDMPPILIVQHIPSNFSKSFAERLTKFCDRPVFEVVQTMQLTKGCAYLAPGNKHIKVDQLQDGLQVVTFDGDKILENKPSVDVLFHSATVLKKVQVIAVLLTGMGNDGAQGMLALKKQGARTITQSEDTCVVWGMPKAAQEIGASEFVEPLGNVGSKIVNCLNEFLATQKAS